MLVLLVFPVFSFSRFDFGVVRLLNGVCYGFFGMLYYKGFGLLSLVFGLNACGCCCDYGWRCVWLLAWGLNSCVYFLLLVVCMRCCLIWVCCGLLSICVVFNLVLLAAVGLVVRAWFGVVCCFCGFDCCVLV